VNSELSQGSVQRTGLCAVLFKSKIENMKSNNKKKMPNELSVGNGTKPHVGGSLPFPEDELKRVQAEINEVNKGSKIDMRKLMNVDAIPLDELGQLLNDIYQLISGFAMDEVWSEWDESVRRRVVKMQIEVQKLNGQ
jgi:hypothetical protein